jgi:hypothetical protein
MAEMSVIEVAYMRGSGHFRLKMADMSVIEAFMSTNDCQKCSISCRLSTQYQPYDVLWSIHLHTRNTTTIIAKHIQNH